MLRVAVLGSGRMGRALLSALEARNDMQAVSVWAREGAGLDAGAVPVRADLPSVLAEGPDVAIDFTLPGATPAVLDAAGRAGIPLVCGVTGLGEAQQAAMAELAKRVPVLFDRNMSLGIAVLKDLAARAAAGLGSGFEVEIHETHHVHKKDAPSGTALALGEAVAEARGQDLARLRRYDPEDPAGARRASPEEIVFRVTRRGEVAGEHSVVFCSGSETLSLGHAVTERRVFAEGALRAAAWLHARPPGLYRMADVAADFSG